MVSFTRKAFAVSLLVCLSILANGQILSAPSLSLKKGGSKILIKKTGVYIGYARGFTDVFELGGERLIKKVKLRKPPTHALHGGINYNFKENVLGYEAGYWFKSGRLRFSYGADLAFRTNFEVNRWGAGPKIGFKMFGFHLQTGYHFLTENRAFLETNTFFIRLRFLFVNDWDIDFKRKKKGK